MRRDGHVRVLPIHVANKIAAGEVVERPASVVKELVENAIDAGAGDIKITVTQGGRKLVSVLDDGCGMSRDDAVLSLERQATSKILDVSDIDEIDTLGFRGEAIPSIASVSRFTLTTRRRDTDEGTQVQVDAGVLSGVSAAGCPPGTLVEVRDLFCNVPARRKFLRSFQTEESHVRHVFTVHALAHPSIGFTLVADGREAYRLAPAASLRDRVADLFGADFVEKMAEIPEKPGCAVRVGGFVGRPNQNTPTRRGQYVFVNGRPATAPAIAYALKEAYPRQQGDAKPAVLLFVTLAPNQVDVNVHPTKREVRFRDGSAVKNAIMAAVAAALNTGGATAQPPLDAHFAQPAAEPCAPAARPTTSAPQAAAPASAPAQPAVRCPIAMAAAGRPDWTGAIPRPAPVETTVEIEPRPKKPWESCRFLAATETGYALFETDSGLVTLNPSAARERIAYEKLLYGNGGGRGAVQRLLIPETVKLPPADAARLRESIGEVEAAGFAIEDFGDDVFKIDAVPQMTGGVSATETVATLAHDLTEPGAKRAGERWREETVAKSVARSCAGMSRALTAAGAAELVEELVACRMPYVSPRGRPTMIFTSSREMDRKFGLS